MFGKKDLERELEQKTQEIALLKKKIDELSDKLVAYQNKEGAIVSAMTEAQASANKTIVAAETRRKEIIEEAIAGKSRIQNEMRELMEQTNANANAIIADANEKADAIIASAKDDAMHLAQNAQAFNENYLHDVAILKDEFKRTAELAEKQAEMYREFFENMDLTSAEERASEYVGLTDALNEEEELPEDYENPASLMRSIYTIQRRDIPENVKEGEPKAQRGAGIGAIISDAAEPVAEEPVDEAFDEETTVDEPDEAEAAQPQEERVWTVDEVVGEDGGEEVDLDDELDALIEDVLRGS